MKKRKFKEILIMLILNLTQTKEATVSTVQLTAEGNHSKEI